MERRILGVTTGHKNALSKLIALIVAIGLVLPTTPTRAQGGLVACFNILDPVWASYYTYEVGTPVITGSLDLVEETVFPYGDGWYARMSFDLRGFAEDVFSTSSVALYSFQFSANPSVITNTDVFTFVTPYANGIAGRVTQHSWVANAFSAGRVWTDVYPELPQADSFSVAMFAESEPVINHFLQAGDLCVYPINVPTATPPASTTPRPTRTPTITVTPSRTRTPTPQTHTPVPSSTSTQTHTPNAQTLTATFVGTGTPVPVPGTLQSGEWRPYDKPPTCGEDELNPCGPLPFPPISFATLAIASPSGIPTLTPNANATAGAGTATPTFSWDAQGTALATMAQYGGAGGYTLYSSANQIGNSIGFTFGLFNALQGLNLGRIGVLLAFILLTLLFIVFVRVATFSLRILLFILKLVRIVP